MVLYITYKSSKDSKERSLIRNRLKTLGCSPIHRSFWEVKEEKSRLVLQVLKNNRPILLRRTRKVEKPEFENHVADLGSLVVIMYSNPKEEKREKIRNFLKRAPCIRLARSVYAFSHMYPVFDKNKNLVTPVKFEVFINEIYKDVKVISRLRIVNMSVIDKLIEEVKQRVEREATDIAMSCKEIWEKTLQKQGDIKKIFKSFVFYKNKFKTLNDVAKYYERWLHDDFSKQIMKAYRAVHNVNSIMKKQALVI